MEKTGKRRILRKQRGLIVSFILGDAFCYNFLHSRVSLNSNISLKVSMLQPTEERNGEAFFPTAHQIDPKEKFFLFVENYL